MKKMDNNNNVVYLRAREQQFIFKIRFSNLFIIENKIGEFQSEIVSRYPESALNIRKQIVYADVGRPTHKLEEIDRSDSHYPKI